MSRPRNLRAPFEKQLELYLKEIWDIKKELFNAKIPFMLDMGNGLNNTKLRVIDNCNSLMDIMIDIIILSINVPSLDDEKALSDVVKLTRDFISNINNMLD